MICPACNLTIAPSVIGGHTHKIEGDYYASYYSKANQTIVKHITYRWDRLPSVMGGAPLNTNIRTILTLDGLHSLTMERIEKLLLLK